MKAFVYNIFMKIAEPRVQRVLQFGVYLFLGIAGVGVVSDPPSAYQHVIGLTLVYIFGAFLVLGSLFGLIAVLPGIYWLERSAIIFLTTAVLIYLVIAISLGISLVVLGIFLAFICTFIKRWYNIKGTLLAPKKG